MSKTHFIIFAPPAHLFEKNDIYTPFSRFSYIHGTYIKAIADCFFLSNKFRFNNTLHYYTFFKNSTYIISFDGKKLRYLGPSYFSASNLLLRALTHIVNPRSKKGKLTPGLSVEKIEEELAVFFPDAGIVRFDLDTAHSKKQYEKMFSFDYASPSCLCCRR